MRLLAFEDRRSDALPLVEFREPGPPMRNDDPKGYVRLIEHLCNGDATLEPWIEELSTGRGSVVLTGQQPAMLGGPLYTLYKTMTAVVAARRARALGRPVLAAFWSVGDDTDHDEVASATWPRRDGPPRRVRDETPAHGVSLGRLEVARMEPAIRQLVSDWPDATEVQERLETILKRSAAEGWSGFLERSLRLLLGDEPFLFVDGRDPVVIASAQPFLRRFVGEREILGREIEAEGSVLRRRGRFPPIGLEEGERSLFVLTETGRQLLEGEPDLSGSSAPLLPNVVLRPALQEYLLPVERVVCGEAEIAYRRLLTPVYARTGRPAAPLLRRFEATLFPSVWSTDPSVPDPAATLHQPIAAMEGWALEQIDPGLLRSLDDLKRRLAIDLDELQAPMARLEKSLIQLLDSVSGKVDYQLGRLQEGVMARGKQRLHRGRPQLAHLQEFLRPRGKPQERVFSIWTPWLVEGRGALDSLDRAIEDWFSRGECGHAFLAFEKEPSV